MIFITLILSFLCVAYVLIKHKDQPLLERGVKISCSLFFLVYILHRVQLQLDYYSRSPQVVTVYVWINWSLVMLLFVSFFISYLIREAPKIRANRWQEFVIPVICAFLPFVIVESPRWYYLKMIRDISWLKTSLKPFYVQTPDLWNPYSIVLLTIGGIITVLAMISLKKSFSIFTEVRVPVYGGIYRYLRHPMYVGEILSTIGLVFLAPSWVNVIFTILFVFLIYVRSRIEESKLLSGTNDYKNYKRKVRF